MTPGSLISPQTILTYTVSNPLALSLFLIALEAVLEKEFSCPCKQGWTGLVIALVVIGPSFLAFAIMFFHFRMCTGCSLENNANKEEIQENLLQCLIPPVVWFIIFFLDGDYFACGVTELDGIYVYNKDLNRKWCQPTEWVLKGNERDLFEYHKYLNKSQTVGYVLVIVLSIAIIGVGCSKCCKNPNSNPRGEPLLNNASSSGAATASGNAPLSGDQTASSNAPLSGDQTASSNAPLSGDQTASSNAPLSGDQTASSNAPLSGGQTASSNAPLSGDQTASSNEPSTGASTASGNESTACCVVC